MGLYGSGTTLTYVDAATAAPLGLIGIMSATPGLPEGIYRYVLPGRENERKARRPANRGTCLERHTTHGTRR